MKKNNLKKFLPGEIYQEGVLRNQWSKTNAKKQFEMIKHLPTIKVWFYLIVLLIIFVLSIAIKLNKKIKNKTLTVACCIFLKEGLLNKIYADHLIDHFYISNFFLSDPLKI